MSRPAFPFRYLAAVAVIGAVVALAACGGTSTSRTSTTPAAAASSPSAGTSPQAQQILQRVQQANLHSANVNVLATESSSGRGTVTTSTGQVTLHPARAQFSTSLTSTSTSSTTQRQAQEVYDSGNLYVKVGNQTKWTRYAWPTVNNPTSEGASQAALYASLQNLGQMQNVQVVGTETVNGVPTYHLHATGSQAANGQSVTYTESLWVNQSNYQPVKMMVQEQTSAGQVAATATFSHWNGGQTIVPPAASEVTNP
jgi:hypothetical protein